MRNLFYGTAAIFFIFCLVSCNPSRFYEKNVNFDDRTWHKDSAATFEFEISDINIQYDFYLNLRNTLTFPFQNIYLNYSMEDTLGNVYDTDLVNIQLFDSKTGKPIGNGLGDIFDHQYKVIDHYSFNNPGIYVFKIKQYMRLDELPEIISTGIRLNINDQ